MYAAIRSKPRRDQITRIVYDWHNTGANQFKRNLDIETAICPLCGASLEDQQHIIHFCTHPRMIEIRKYHFIKINSSITTALRPNPTTSTLYIEKFHAIAVQPTHYPLLVGRVHTAQLTALSLLPEISYHFAPAMYKHVVEHCKQYAAMVLHLYSERGSLLKEQEDDPNSRLLTKRKEKRHGVPIERTYLEHIEAIRGVEQHNTIMRMEH